MTTVTTGSGGPGPIPLTAEYATLTDDDLVTGEAVALDLPAASLGSRILSGLIDVILTGVVLVVVVLLLIPLAFRTDAALTWVAIVGTMITVFLILPTTVETATRGKSLGKLALGLRAVRDDAGPVSFQHSFVRALVGFVEIYVFFGVPAFFSALLSSKGKRLGDYAAGTYVVRERVVLVLPPPPMMPPPLARWAAGADIASLPIGLAVAIRQFLGRVQQIEPAARQSLGARLAEQTSPYVAPAPPPGTPPEAFLAAVIAARRDRDHARLVREDELRRRLTSRP